MGESDLAMMALTSLNVFQGDTGTACGEVFLLAECEKTSSGGFEKLCRQIEIILQQKRDSDVHHLFIQRPHVYHLTYFGVILINKGLRPRFLSQYNPCQHIQHSK